MSRTNAIEIRVEDAYQLSLFFPNGSKAEVNLKNRVESCRFCTIVEPEVFKTAHIKDGHIVWQCKDGEFSVHISEILESMLV